jgi:hypothetical protein
VAQVLERLNPGGTGIGQPPKRPAAPVVCFEVVLPRDATNSDRPHLAEASLEDIDRYVGAVVPLAEAVERL